MNFEWARSLYVNLHKMQINIKILGNILHCKIHT